ncbi:MAG TPA: bacillithiol system redox-active protein YtxJ [Ohtaekwangia sp.]|nr:bacillithiol system redox-active protein YtxJ [Ohtaekwangia sp.]
MNWIKLNHPQQLTQLLADSNERPVLIFKHSSRCSISRAALDRLERNWKADEVGQIDQYFLDLLSSRDISNQIEQLFQVDHESPQVLIVDKGKVIYHRSHFEIDYRNLRSTLKSA